MSPKVESLATKILIFFGGFSPHVGDNIQISMKIGVGEYVPWFTLARQLIVAAKPTG